MADPTHNLTAEIPNDTGYSCFIPSFHHQTTQSFGNEGCQTPDYFGYSVPQLCSPSRKTVEDHRESGGDAPSQATTKEADNLKEKNPTKQNASTMTQGEFGFNFPPFISSPGYSMTPSHSPYQLYGKRESYFPPPFVGTHPYCNYFYLPSIFPNAIPYCSNLCYQHQGSEHPEKNRIRRNSEQTRNKSKLDSNHEDSTELESTPNFDTSASHPPQNTWKYPYYPPCVISNQNKICYHPLVPVVVPSCYFDSHNLSSQNMLSESQATEEHLEKQCRQNREHIITHDSDLTSPSPSVLSNNVSTVDLSSPECSMPQNTVLSKESNSPHLSSSLYYTASEQEQKHNGLKGNEEGDAHVKGRDSDKSMKDFCKYEHKNTVSGLKHKSRIPKVSKTNIPLPMSDHKNKNSATGSHNNATLSVSNQGNTDENKSLKRICKLSPVNTKLKNNFPQQIVKKYEQEICHNKPLEEVHNSSKNEMKWTLYQSEIRCDSVSLNMLNIRNNSEDNHAETYQNANISEKFAMPSNNTNSINNFKVQHNSRSKMNVVNLQDHQETGLSHIATNENQPLQRDGSPSPEIDLDRLALQLILNNQGSEDGDMGDVDEEYEQIDHMDQTEKNEGLVRQTSILDRDNELQNVFVEDEVYKLYHEKPKMVSKFSNVQEIINNQEGSILNIQRTDNTTDLIYINNDHLYKEESSKIWQGGEPIEITSSVSHQQICDLSENDDCSVESECSYHCSQPSIPVSLSLDNKSSAAKLLISILAKQQEAKNCNGNVEEGQGIIRNKNVEGVINRITARHEQNINSVPTQDISSTIIQNNSQISQKMDSDHEQNTNNFFQKPSDYREIGKTTTNSLSPELRDNSSSLLSETHNSVPNYPQKKLHLKKSNPPTARQNPNTQKPINHNFVWKNGSHKCSY